MTVSVLFSDPLQLIFFVKTLVEFVGKMLSLCSIPAKMLQREDFPSFEEPITSMTFSLGSGSENPEIMDLTYCKSLQKNYMLIKIKSIKMVIRVVE